jgi:prevent-host-death family protein
MFRALFASAMDRPGSIHAAKTNLSKILARVEAGEEIVIARGKIPIARLTPVHAPRLRAASSP